MTLNEMKPITFRCHATLSLSPDEIAEQVLDVTNWPDFHGCWPIPGIKTASFDIRTASIIGSRIRVMNLDGSTHVEEIVEWQPDQRIQLYMQNFSPPLSRLATGILETWKFQRIGSETKVIRSFEMHAKSAATWPVLWVVSFVLKRAIDRHLHEMSMAL